MKTLKLSFIALFIGLASVVFAEENASIDELVQAIREDPNNAAEMVQTVVADSPGQTIAVVNRLLATFPELAEAISYGAISGLPTPLAEDDVALVVSNAVRYRPGLAGEIVAGAIRAAPEMEPTIVAAARSALRGVPGVMIGRTHASPRAEFGLNTALRVISPSANQNN